MHTGKAIFFYVIVSRDEILNVCILIEFIAVRITDSQDEARLLTNPSSLGLVCNKKTKWPCHLTVFYITFACLWFAQITVLRKCTSFKPYKHQP